MTQTSPLIVLNSTKSGERSLVIHCLTPAWGRRSFITTIGAKCHNAYFQPLSILDAEVLENPKSELWRLRSVKPSFPLMGIRSDMTKNAISLFVSEVLYRAVKDGTGDEAMFEWLRRSVLCLDTLEGSFSNFHLRFLMEFAAQLGFSPDKEGLARFAGEHFARVSRLLEADFKEFMLEPMTGVERNDIAACLLDYISFHLESKIDVRSLKVLREVCE